MALYIDHPDGTTTVYGHLQRAVPVVADLIRKLQYQKESFANANYNGYIKTRTRRQVPHDILRQEVRKDVELILYSQYANAMILASLFMPLVAVNGAVRRIVMYFALFMVLLIPKAFREFLDPQSGGILKLLFGGILLYLLLSGVYGSSYAYSLIN